MTEPEASDADRQEQAAALTSGGPGAADEVTPPGDDVPEADAIEQQLAASPGGSASFRAGTPEADEYDVLEQQAVVPDDEDDVRD
jgi:hypothetical protein